MLAGDDLCLSSAEDVKALIAATIRSRHSESYGVFLWAARLLAGQWRLIEPRHEVLQNDVGPISAVVRPTSLPYILGG